LQLYNNLVTLNFIEKVLDFLFKGEQIDNTELHIFTVASTMMGLVCITIDFVYYKISGKSLFNLSYIGLGTIWVFLFWGIGAGFVSYIGAILGILATTVQTCVIVGISWPLIFPRLIDYISKKEPDEQPTSEKQN